MTFSPTANLMLTAQLLAGLAGAALVPSLVVLIANEYHGQEQAAALGALGSARAGAGVLAFLIGGVLGTYIGWRPAFGTLIVVSAVVLLLGFKLKPTQGWPEVQIDLFGVLLTALDSTNVSREQIKEAVRINEEARPRALKIGPLIMAALSLLAIFPAGRLPNYKPGEIPANQPLPKPKREETLEGPRRP